MATMFNLNDTICDNTCFDSYIMEIVYDVNQLQMRILFVLFIGSIEYLNILVSIFEHCFPLSREIVL